MQFPSLIQAEWENEMRWTCPYCSIVQTVVRQQYTASLNSLIVSGQDEGPIALQSLAIGCSNDECGKTTVTAVIQQAQWTNARGIELVEGGTVFLNERLLPRGSATPQPDYIPKPLRDDYYEACLIRDLSPKASATLIRRCLQGMIRDFAKIQRRSLNDEISELRKAVDDGTADRSVTYESIDAIDHVRKIGNIGAHMEKDIDLIIDVDPGEAQALIEIVEMLFAEWYVARHTRQAKLALIKRISEDKDEKKKG